LKFALSYLDPQERVSIAFAANVISIPIVRTRDI